MLHTLHALLLDVNEVQLSVFPLCYDLCCIDLTKIFISQAEIFAIFLQSRKTRRFPRRELYHLYSNSKRFSLEEEEEEVQKAHKLSALLKFCINQYLPIVYKSLSDVKSA